MPDIPPALAVDSCLCKCIRFIVSALLASEKGDTKTGHTCKVTRIDWKHRPSWWPANMPFSNPKGGITTPEKWAMLFISLSCLRKTNIDTVLSNTDDFLLRVELMALESSAVDIIKDCHDLRYTTCLPCILNKPWKRHIFFNMYPDVGLLVEACTNNKNTSDSDYADLEKTCKNGSLPEFLKKIPSFQSMKTLDAETAMTVAEECLHEQHKSTRAKNNSSSTETAMTVAKECLQHESTGAKNNSSSTETAMAAAIECLQHKSTRAKNHSSPKNKRSFPQAKPNTNGKRLKTSNSQTLQPYNSPVSMAKTSPTPSTYTTGKHNVDSKCTMTAPTPTSQWCTPIKRACLNSPPKVSGNVCNPLSHVTSTRTSSQQSNMITSQPLVSSTYPVTTHPVYTSRDVMLSGISPHPPLTSDNTCNSTVTTPDQNGTVSSAMSPTYTYSWSLEDFDDTLFDDLL